jgi:hypothetical protein
MTASINASSVLIKIIIVPDRNRNIRFPKVIPRGLINPGGAINASLLVVTVTSKGIAVPFETVIVAGFALHPAPGGAPLHVTVTVPV